MAEPDKDLLNKLPPAAEFTLLADAIRYVTGREPQDFKPVWPPDVFGLCAYLLSKGGGYIRAVREWPPATMVAKTYPNRIKTIAVEWRKISPSDAPDAIKQWWKSVLDLAGQKFEVCHADGSACEPLLLLCAAADEACAGFGFPNPAAEGKLQPYDYLASYLLRVEETLSRSLRKEVCRILPKSHTPQSGITIRSLSHHLSFLWGGDVVPTWRYVPWMRSKAQVAQQSLNLLLIPYPFEVKAEEFHPLRRPPPLKNLGEGFGFFEYASPADNDTVDDVLIPLVKAAAKKMGRVDGVILPELALSESAFDRFWDAIRRDYPRTFLAAGTGLSQTGVKLGKNTVRVAFSIGTWGSVVQDQAKHHRWKLNESQIRQYDLCHRLNPYTQWWEAIDIESRRLQFFAAEPWLTMCFLICEDLARQDPVAQAVRAVGPNLIVSLLMDGPQLAGRWSNRYATVFADDPGSSVLSMTSLGMALRSKPPTEKPVSRVVALWKEPDASSREIALSENAQAVVLVVNQRYLEEWSADGRSDGKTTGSLSFGGQHEIRLEDSTS